MESSDNRSDLDRRLDAIRQRTRPAVLKRIDAIELAVGDGSVRTDLPIARSEVHKLRGLLGTIGLGHGSELAATIEDELEGAIEGRAAAGWERRVAEMTTELRSEIEAS
jgi:HPt (histidine-containing phosphotransfer) domain-containing protein